MEAFLEVTDTRRIFRIRTTDIVAIEPDDTYPELHHFTVEWRSGAEVKRGLVDVGHLINAACIDPKARPTYGRPRELARWFKREAPNLVAEFFRRRRGAENWLRYATPAGHA